MFFSSEINNNYFSVQVFRAGVLQHESQHGLHGFAAAPAAVTRRRRRHADEEISLGSTTTTPIRNTRAATSQMRSTPTTEQARYIASSPVHVATTSSAVVQASNTTSDDECQVCYQHISSANQRHCAGFRQMLCGSCAQEIIIRHSTDNFECPFCRANFVNDVIDLFGED